VWLLGVQPALRIDVLKACTLVLERTCEAEALVLGTTRALREPSSYPPPPERQLLDEACLVLKSDSLGAYSTEVEEVIVTQQLCLNSDVSRMLGVSAHRIAYHYMTHKLPEPALKLGNRRVFTLADVQKVAKALWRPVGETEAR
jgi:hypothetical protein